MQAGTTETESAFPQSLLKRGKRSITVVVLVQGVVIETAGAAGLRGDNLGRFRVAMCAARMLPA